LNVTPDWWIFASRYAQGYHQYYISYAVRTKEQTLRDHHALRHWKTFICFDRKKVPSASHRRWLYRGTTGIRCLTHQCISDEKCRVGGLRINCSQDVPPEPSSCAPPIKQPTNSSTKASTTHLVQMAYRTEYVQAYEGSQSASHRTPSKE
jgi:hypothetical protein